MSGLGLSSSAVIADTIAPSIYLYVYILGAMGVAMFYLLHKYLIIVFDGLLAFDLFSAFCKEVAAFSKSLFSTIWQTL